MAKQNTLGIDYDKAPRHPDSVRRYVENGYRPGGFLTAVLENSLSDAVFRADNRNKELLEDWVNFVYWELPSSCWGSPEKVQEWIESGGLADQ